MSKVYIHLWIWLNLRGLRSPIPKRLQSWNAHRQPSGRTVTLSSPPWKILLNRQISGFFFSPKTCKIIIHKSKNCRWNIWYRAKNICICMNNFFLTLHLGVLALSRQSLKNITAWLTFDNVTQIWETNWPRHSFSEPLCNNGMLISPLQLHLDLAPHNEWINFSIAFFSLFLWLNYTHFPRCARFQNHFLSSRASSSWMSPQDSEAVSVLDPCSTWLVTL